MWIEGRADQEGLANQTTWNEDFWKCKGFLEWWEKGGLGQGICSKFIKKYREVEADNISPEHGQRAHHEANLILQKRSLKNRKGKNFSAEDDRFNPKNNEVGRNDQKLEYSLEGWHQKNAVHCERYVSKKNFNRV